MPEINICFASDNNYAAYMGVAIYSILKNAFKEDVVRFYILDSGIKEETKRKIASLNSLKSFEINYFPMKEEKFKCLHINQGYITLATFYRFILADVLPEVSKIIYLDCDLMVLNSLSSLFNTDIKDYACAGVTDIMPAKYIEKTFSGKILKHNYVNAGVMLINLNFWRKDGAAKKLFDYVLTYKPAFNDQDAINYVFRNKIKLLPYQYNVMTGHFVKFGRKINHSDIIIRHFTAKDKPWKADGFQPLTEVFREYMGNSPWADILPGRKGGFAYWFCRFLNYWRVHPVFFLKIKFYKNLFNAGFKAAVK